MLFKLFITFFKIGLFTFGGGYAMIPIIQREIIDRRGWVRKEDFLELLTVAQTAPGPISLNSAVFVGYKVAGFWGAVCSVLGVVVPSFTVILIIAMFFSTIRENEYVDAAFKAMRPAVVALILSPVIGFMKNMNKWGYMVVPVVALLTWYGISPVYFLLLAIFGAILWTKFLGKEVRK